MSGVAPSLKDSKKIIEEQQETLAAIRSKRRSAIAAVLATFDGFNIEGSLLMLVPHEDRKNGDTAK